MSAKLKVEPTPPPKPDADQAPSTTTPNVPPPGRKLSTQEAIEHVFTVHREAMERLAKH